MDNKLEDGQLSEESLDFPQAGCGNCEIGEEKAKKHPEVFRGNNPFYDYNGEREIVSEFSEADFAPEKEELAGRHRG